MNSGQYRKVVKNMGCVVEGCDAPAEVHHPRFDCGGSQRANHFLVIPLCAYHHRTGGIGQAIHAGQTTFELNYGKESELLALTIRKLIKKLERK